MGNHYPVFTRQWVEKIILTEFPNVRFVLQCNRQCPALLKCPEARAADMVKLAITASDGMDNIKIIYKPAQLISIQIEDFTKSERDIRVFSSVDDVLVELYTINPWIIF